MTYNISINNKSVEWTEDSVKTKLESLGELEGKEVAWIREDLSIKKSNWLTRLIWTVVAKHFDWMRRSFFGVNLNTSSSVLEQISRQIDKKSELSELYNQAVLKFQDVAPKHSGNLELIESLQDDENHEFTVETNLTTERGQQFDINLVTHMDIDDNEFQTNIDDEIETDTDDNMDIDDDETLTHWGGGTDTDDNMDIDDDDFWIGNYIARDNDDLDLDTEWS